MGAQAVIRGGGRAPHPSPVATALHSNLKIFQYTLVLGVPTSL